MWLGLIKGTTGVAVRASVSLYQMTQQYFTLTDAECYIKNAQYQPLQYGTRKFTNNACCTSYSVFSKMLLLKAAIEKVLEL